MKIGMIRLGRMGGDTGLDLEVALPTLDAIA